MSVSGEVPAASAPGGESAVVCDASGFDLRFLRAAMIKLGYRQVLEAKTLEELEAKATVMQPALIVFDPAMEDGAGLDVLNVLQQVTPDTLLIAFCSDDSVARSVKCLGLTTVEKVSILKVDALVAAIEEARGAAMDHDDDAIPVTDVATPVWEEVPSLVEA